MSQTINSKEESRRNIQKEPFCIMWRGKLKSNVIRGFIWKVTVLNLGVKDESGIQTSITYWL